MTWAVTYTCHDARGRPQSRTERLDAEWCAGSGTDPADLESAEDAAWAVALLLGSHGDDDAELTRVEWEDR